jgi:hypothetical protein
MYHNSRRFSLFVFPDIEPVRPDLRLASINHLTDADNMDRQVSNEATLLDIAQIFSNIYRLLCLSTFLRCRASLKHRRASRCGDQLPNLIGTQMHSNQPQISAFQTSPAPLLQHFLEHMVASSLKLTSSSNTSLNLLTPLTFILLLLQCKYRRKMLLCFRLTQVCLLHPKRHAYP